MEEILELIKSIGLDTYKYGVNTISINENVYKYSN